jgi:hypothetical protein
MRPKIMGLALYVAHMGWTIVNVHGIFVGKCKE